MIHTRARAGGSDGRKICGSPGRLQLHEDLQQVLTLLHGMRIPGQHWRCSLSP